MATLKSSREIDRVFECGQRTAHPLVIALVAPTPTGRDQTGRVAFIAGRRIGGAVLRNRAKRLLREGMRAAGGPWPGHDVLLMARPRLVESDSATVGRSVADVIQRAGVRT